MDFIKITKDLARQLQKTDEYISYQLIQQSYEDDEQLQGLISEFNEKKDSINSMMSQGDATQEQIQNLNSDLQNLYAQIIQNEVMISLNNSKEKLDDVMNKVQYILSEALSGSDIDSIDVNNMNVGNGGGGCGSCSSGGCGSCH